MTLDQARERLEAHGQAQALACWEHLDEAARARLLAQVASLDFDALSRMRALLRATGEQPAAPRGALRAPEVATWTAETRAAAMAVGEAELRAGRVAVLLVAGGQGSRLGYEGPKGAYPIGPVSGRSLFYFHARRIVGLGRRYGARIPFYVMTSEANDAATRSHFAENGFLGLEPSDVIFFVQGMWPALDAAGRIILDEPGHIFMSPDGHGGTLAALARNGCLADMAQRGIRSVFYFQVDNPLVEIADPAFIGLHVTRGAEMSLKLCARRHAGEGLGVVVARDAGYELVEYSELTPEQAGQRADDGELYLKYGSVAVHVFSLDFLQAEATRDLPLHIARKKIPTRGADGRVTQPEAPNGYKFEKFIFDALPHARKAINLAFDRAEEFSPVKNATGDDSPDTCRRDLQAKWARWLRAAGIEVAVDASGLPAVPIEIDPAYALDAADLAARGLLLTAP